MISFEIALVKFNGGRGALLCNSCRTIIAYGFDHEDRLHYCEPFCPPKNYSELYIDLSED